MCGNRSSPVADAAGGEWPDRARGACTELVRTAEEDRRSLGVKLLADLRDVFSGADRMATAQIIEKLAALDDSPWSDLRGKPLNSRSLYWRLREYATADNKPIRPRNVRTAAGTLKGYCAEDLRDAWMRYLPPGLP
ncbi:DUF3631 domain-containing protein [Streptomyces narbonensis]|uniref:DUF3631 domain-containing protein n=1 Tax=Streptomyces narbonensis TaxID=67333 RepID=UPI003F5407F4